VSHGIGKTQRAILDVLAKHDPIDERPWNRWLSTRQVASLVYQVKRGDVTKRQTLFESVRRHLRRHRNETAEWSATTTRPRI
jgi:hypothetical protein